MRDDRNFGQWKQVQSAANTKVWNNLPVVASLSLPHKLTFRWLVRNKRICSLHKHCIIRRPLGACWMVSGDGEGENPLLSPFWGELHN